jgi:hypothetical protein
MHDHYWGLGVVLHNTPCQHNERTGVYVAMQHGQIHCRANLHAQHRSVGQCDSIWVLVFAIVTAWLPRLGIRTYIFLTRLPTLLSRSVTSYLALYP